MGCPAINTKLLDAQLRSATIGQKIIGVIVMDSDLTELHLEVVLAVYVALWHLEVY
jgi:hypothetical protein